jgi:hypothetical protein
MRLGVSVAVAFDYETGEYTVHLQDNLGALWYRLTRAALVVGFNIRRFDIPVLFGHVQNDLGTGGSDPGEMESLEASREGVLANAYDIYEESKIGAGAGKYDRGYRADDHLRAIWGAGGAKTGSGADAPRLWKEDRMGELTTYCLADVHRERRLFERCWTAGRLRSLGFKEGKADFPIIMPQDKLCVPRDTPLPFLMDPTTQAFADAMQAGFEESRRPGAEPPAPPAPHLPPTERPALASEDI